MHGEYENTQLEKSQKSQGQDFCRFLLLCIEAEIAPRHKINKNTAVNAVFFNIVYVCEDGQPLPKNAFL